MTTAAELIAYLQTLPSDANVQIVGKVIDRDEPDEGEYDDFVDFDLEAHTHFYNPKVDTCDRDGRELPRPIIQIGWHPRSCNEAIEIN